MKEIRLTGHAAERLKERSILSPDEILSVIREDRAEIITIEEYSNRLSLLFFSASENMFHVLVIDISTQEVITVLPIEYWENLRNPKKENRFLNTKSIILKNLFNAVKLIDEKHMVLQHPPLPGRENIYFFAYCMKDSKRRSKKIGFVSISEITKSTKESCISKLKSSIESGLEELELESDVITIFWKTTPGQKVSRTDRQHFVHFDTFIDFSILYEAALSDVCLRIKNSRTYPEFQRVYERTINTTNGSKASHSF